MRGSKAIVAKEAIAWQLRQAMKARKISKKRLAEMIATSRAQVDCILDQGRQLDPRSPSARREDRGAKLEGGVGVSNRFITHFT